MLRPCPHPTTHRFNKLKQNVLTDLPFKVENGLSKVMKCLGGKSLDLHRRQWERPTYALNSHTCLLRCKCEKSYLRHQALRMTYEAVFSHNYRWYNEPLTILSPKDFPDGCLIFFAGYIYIWQLTAEMTDELPAKPTNRTSHDHRKS